MKKLLNILLLGVLAVSCDRLYDTPTDDGRLNAGIDEEKPKFYMELYDRISDKGQYNHPDIMGEMEKDKTGMYELFNLGAPTRNDPKQTGLDAGLQYHLTSQSFSGIVNRALAKGKVVTGSWMDGGNGIAAYKDVIRHHKTAGTWIVGPAWHPLNTDAYDGIDGGLMSTMGRRYVLTDVANNPESGIVGVVASHVYDAVIFDVRDEAHYKTNVEYTMVYDARRKTTADAWAEFKDDCNNNGLVVMPVHTGELADFAIANNLFVVNINKQSGTAAGGQNAQLFKDILAWLKPNSFVYGWETGVGEDVFVTPVSASGNTMVAIHDMNLPWFAKGYKSMQNSKPIKIIDPHDIDYSKDNKYVSYYLSDGPHAGWMINGFIDDYYSDPMVADVNMNFGICASLSAQISPLQLDKIFALQYKNSTLIESFGRGYWYSDNYAIDRPNRASILKEQAEMIAAYMRQHRIKVLEQIAMDPKSAKAMETFQAMVDANDQLEGIVAIQYAPSYAQCEGEILWVTNKAGYDIPIVTARYSIWNTGGTNTPRHGSPTYVARKLNEEPAANKFSAVIVHAWSGFEDTGMSADETAENAAVYPKGKKGASAAELCNRRLQNYEAVSMQELIWRVRMEYRPEQTNKFLAEYL